MHVLIRSTCGTDNTNKLRRYKLLKRAAFYVRGFRGIAVLDTVIGNAVATLFLPIAVVTTVGKITLSTVRFSALFFAFCHYRSTHS